LRRRNRRAAGGTAVLAGVIVILVLVVLSPIGLRTVSALPNLNWGRLSNVGQTYGAVSALFAALALVGVSISVLLQLREIRFNRLEAGRARHYELIRLAMENPSYLGIFSFPEDASIEVRQAIAYINLCLQFWQMLWEFSDISETELRAQARGLFSTSQGRDYWRQYGHVRLANDNTKKERAFDRAIDIVYKEAVASGPPANMVPSLESSAPGKRTLDPNKLIGLAFTFACGITIGRLVRRPRDK
jgi:hypothetical protein